MVVSHKRQQGKVTGESNKLNKPVRERRCICAFPLADDALAVAVAVAVALLALEVAVALGLG